MRALSMGVGEDEEEEEEEEGTSTPDSEATWTSSPVVKALEPAPERTMARVDGSWERWSKMERSSSHILIGGRKTFFLESSFKKKRNLKENLSLLDKSGSEMYIKKLGKVKPKK